MNIPSSRIVRQDHSFLRLVGQGTVDLLAIGVAAAVSYFLLVAWNNFSGASFVTIERLIAERFVSFSSVSIIVFFYFLTQGHYHMRIPFWEETKTVVAASFLALLLEGFFIYANKADVSRTAVFMTWVLMPFFVMWSRTILHRLQGASRLVRVTIFGRESEALRAKTVLESDKHMRVSVVEISEEMDAHNAYGLMDRNSSSDAIVAMSGADGSEITLISELRRLGVNVSVLPPAIGMSASMNVHYILGMDAMLLVSRPEITPRLSRLSKRIFDLVVASMILSVLIIPMILIAIMISIDGGNPIYSHQRVGKGGKRFGCLKFRSMYLNSDAILDEYLERHPEALEEWEINQKLIDDPRITKIGHFLRQTSIDEFPQLLNVIKGDMSLIGPRPVTAKELDHYGSSVALYGAVKPGMTGLWQVSGRSSLSYDRRVSLDAWYVENWSPWHDIAILAKTVPVVLKRAGAY